MAVKKGTSKAEKILGSKDNDTLEGMAGNDTLISGAGNDFLDGGTGNDSIDGGIGNDILVGGDGRDILVGGSGDDKLDGGKDDDTLNGDVGKDTLNGGAGVDKLTGGDGNDYYIIDNSKDVVTETNKNLKIGGDDTVETSLVNYTLPKNVENLIFTGNANNNGTGNELNNKITGNIGDNQLFGEAGNDWIISASGVDLLDGGLGMDTLEGGDDDDVYVMNNIEDQIIETENGGEFDLVKATVSFDLNSAPNVEGLELSGQKALDGTGNDLSNLLQESENGVVANTFRGMKGDDTINAEGGDDTLEGGEGNDILDGSEGTDTAEFSHNVDQYQITTNSDEKGIPQIIVKYVGDATDTGIDEGEDILTNVEILQFADSTQINAADVISGKFNDKEAPIFKSATVNSNVLVLSYEDEHLLDGASAPASAFVVVNGSTSNTVTAVSTDVNAKTITLILASTVLAGQNVTVTYNDPTTGDDKTAIQDELGNDAISLVTQNVVNNTVDNVSPVFASAAVNGNVLTMIYSETNLLNAMAAPASAFSVTNNGIANTVSSVAVDVNTKVVTLILSNTVKNSETVTVAYSDPSTSNDINAIQDAAGNDAASLPVQTVVNNTLDNTPPVFVSANVSGNVLTMTYSEALNVITAPASAFSVINGGVANPVTSVTVDTNAKTVTLILSNVVSNMQTVTVAYTDLTTNNDVNAVQDAAGNDVLSFAAQNVVNNSLDSTPPVFASASVDSKILSINYTEADLLSTTPALASSFTVINNGVANPVTAVTVDAAAKKVTLTLSNAVINGQIVTVAYNDPTTGNDLNAVQDATGNDTISLPAQNVTNVTVAAAVVQPPVVTPPVVTPPTETPTITALPADARTYAIEFPLSEGADSLDGSPANEKFLGLGGNDVLNGKAGDDYLDGGLDDDKLYGDVGDDYLLGGDGVDVISGGTGNDSIDGGNGNNKLTGEDGDDLIVSGVDNDSIEGGNGNDTISSGNGNDTVKGSSGNDSISTGEGNDSIVGDSGNDTIDAGAGNDKVDLSSSYYSSSSYGSNLIHGGDGDDYIRDYAINNDKNAPAQQLYGDEGSDTIIGWGRLYGGAGNDYLEGGWMLNGEDGNDTLVGYKNNDGQYFYGGAGVDRITTGAGADSIGYSLITHSGVGTGNRDIITDFDTSSGDYLSLYPLSANPLNFLAMAEFDGSAGAVRFTPDPVNKYTLVQVDINGDKAADMEIELTGLKFLAADDFVLAKPV